MIARRNFISLWFMALAVLNLAGCDPAFSVRHESDQIQRIPERACVMKALENVEGLKAVKYSERKNNFETCDENSTHSYSYVFENKEIAFELCTDKSGVRKARHYWGGLGLAPSSKVEIDSVRNKMKDVESKIEVNCLPGLSQALKETCLAVDCSK